MAAPFQIILNTERTTQYTFDLYKADGLPYTIDTNDTVRIVAYRRSGTAAIFDLKTGVAATANGSSLAHVTTVPTPTGTVPQVLLTLGEDDLVSLVPGTVLNIEVNVTDNNGTPVDGTAGAIKGYAYVLETHEGVVT